MSVADDIRNALVREKLLKALPPPACSGATVSCFEASVKPRMKTLCERCGWWTEKACSSELSAVPGRTLISEDGASCEWFEDDATINRGWHGYVPDKEPGKKKRQAWKPATLGRVWGKPYKRRK